MATIEERPPKRLDFGIGVTSPPHLSRKDGSRTGTILAIDRVDRIGPIDEGEGVRFTVTRHGQQFQIDMPAKDLADRLDILVAAASSRMAGDDIDGGVRAVGDAQWAKAINRLTAVVAILWTLPLLLAMATDDSSSLTGVRWIIAISPTPLIWLLLQVLRRLLRALAE